MTSLHDKEKASENKYARDKELDFKVHARRNKLFGQWVAKKLGLAGEEAESYAKAFVAADVGRPDDNALLERARQDLAGKGAHVAEHDLNTELHQALQTAKQQITQ